MNKRTISLPNEQSDYIDEKVASGEYGSASEVVRAGLRALKERDRAIEDWLRTEVAATYDAMAEKPDRAIPTTEVFNDVRKRHKDNADLTS